MVKAFNGDFCPSASRLNLYTREKTLSGISELRTTVRLGDFGWDAQFSLTYDRMYLSDNVES